MILVGDLNVAHNEIDIYDATNKHKYAGFTPEERYQFDDLLRTTNLIDSFRHFNPRLSQFTYWSTR